MLDMKHAITLATLLALSLAASDVQAQGAGNLEEGFTLARQVCAECHAVRKGQVRSPNPRSPTFPELASTPGMTATALFVTLQTPHAGMPMFILTDEQRANIIAYILSLKE
jgi:mono/diheme cytochrome c family protein